MKKYYILKIASNDLETLSKHFIFKIFWGDPQTPLSHVLFDNGLYTLVHKYLWGYTSIGYTSIGGTQVLGLHKYWVTQVLGLQKMYWGTQIIP